jgi:branched-chain amino acid transport system substrate-binding protein
MVHYCVKHVFLCVVCILLAAVSCHKKESAFQCEDIIGCVDIGPEEPLKIGALQALSGKVAPLGQEQIRGMTLALDAMGNEILGHRVDIQTVDTGCSSEGGANAVLRLIADPQTVGIFGSTCSGAARTAARAMSQAGLTMVSGNNSAPFLTSLNGERAPDWNEGYFRVSKNEEFSGRAAAMFAFKKLGVRRAATLNDGDIYTQGLSNGFARAFEQLGGRVVLSTTVGRGESQMGPVLTAVVNSEAQMLFFPLFQPEGNHIIRQGRSFPGLKDLVYMAGGALIEQSFIDSVSDKARGMYFVGPSNPDGPGSSALVKRYTQLFSTRPSTNYYMYGFDAMNLLVSAVARACVKDGDGSLHIGRKTLRDTLYATQNIQGVTGPLSCNEFGDCSTPDFSIMRLDDPSAGVEGLQANVIARFTFN